MPAPPDKFTVVCPVTVIPLPGQPESVAVMAPDEDSVGDEKAMPWVPLVMGRLLFVKIPLASVAVNVPAAVSLHAGQVTLQLPV